MHRRKVALGRYSPARSTSPEMRRRSARVAGLIGEPRGFVLTRRSLFTQQREQPCKPLADRVLFRARESEVTDELDLDQLDLEHLGMIGAECARDLAASAREQLEALRRPLDQEREVLRDARELVVVLAATRSPLGDRGLE